jgi:hypothetical protein
VHHLKFDWVSNVEENLEVLRSVTHLSEEGRWIHVTKPISFEDIYVLICIRSFIYTLAFISMWMFNLCDIEVSSVSYYLKEFVVL